MVAKPRVLAPTSEGEGFSDRESRRVLVELVNVRKGVLDVELPLVLDKFRERCGCEATVSKEAPACQNKWRSSPYRQRPSVVTNGPLDPVVPTGPQQSGDGLEQRGPTGPWRPKEQVRLAGLDD